MAAKRFKTVDEYLFALPEEARTKMAEIRQIVKESAPEANEVISYNMPAYKQNGVLLYFAAHKEHIGLYPFPSATAAFRRELSKYKSGKGSIRLSLDKPIPRALIRKIVKFRVEEDLAKAKKRAR